ncbi:splicing factor 3a [Chaetomidium leptoderma]|uniref:Splicing factor 3a n=1 Tax=Chaetomidium leptoderma TaxID=669021 RepID=A0AAN6VUN7_9PEZI|nr:splicing factor 3a [Chaetomidium leptoderma]
MLLEGQRYIHEDLERLEQGIADRMGEEPKHIRDRLNRDHEVAQLLDQIQRQSADLLPLYEDKSGLRSKEILQISTGDPLEEFYRQVSNVKEHHARYPNEQAENSEQWYRPQKGGDDQPYIVESMFSGEEAYGRFFDLHSCHESFLNLPNTKRLGYMQYLEVFDNFQPGYGGVKRVDKLTGQYFKYLGDLMGYLESFMRRTRPLENIDEVLNGWQREFETAWEKGEVQGWQKDTGAKTNATEQTLGTAEAVWCEACEKEFKNGNVYKGHLSGRKHIKAAELLAQRKDGPDGNENGAHATSSHRLKERAVAEREFRAKKLTGAMNIERDDTRVNVERRQGMTERERAQELENLYNMTSGAQNRDTEEEEDEEGDDKLYNPLKLPLAWDGKPIPFWLYRLHGLGQEFPCEVCGNFVYRGRRAFDKHFNETNHITNLKRLGITDTYLFRDITSIEQATRLWEKIQRDQNRGQIDDGAVVQMEDAEGNVMPEKVYLDLQKQVQCKPIPALYTVYILRSTVRHASLYIGSTPNPPRRLSQHNGLVRGGAARTSRNNLRPWEMVGLVSGFPSMTAALKFEWALTNPHISVHIPSSSRLAVSTRAKANGRPRRPSKSLASVVSNLHLLLRVPSFARWPLQVHFFNRDVFGAWEKWCSTANEQLRASLGVVTDFGGQGDGEQQQQQQQQQQEPDPWGIHALPLDYEAVKEYVAKGQDIFEFERQGQCVLCRGDMTSGEGLHALCSNNGCDGVGHVSCWSQHLLGGDEADSIVPVQGQCPKCKGEVLWGGMMKELTLRVRGQKDVEKLLKRKRRRVTKKVTKA